MKIISVLFFSGSLWALSLNPELAEQQYRDYEFKKSLVSYSDLLKQTPTSLVYLLRVADLKFLVEGRNSAVQLLRESLDKQKGNWTQSEKQDINRKIIELSQKFLLEEAQTHYLQAKLKTQLNDWTASIAPINQAASIETGNLKILILKSEIEQRLGLTGPAYQSLKEAYLIDPQSEKTVERLCEAHVFHGHFQEVSNLLEKKERQSLSPRNKLALAVAKWELGKKSESQKIIEELSRHRKNEFNQHPALAWMSFRIETENSQDSSQADLTLKTFLKSATPKEKLLIDGWDPYRLAAQVERLSR